MNDLTHEIPPLSDGTKAAVAHLVDYTIEREYGHEVDAEIKGATMLALAGLQFDLDDQYLSINGHRNGLEGYARSVLRILVRDGLAERVCQCRTLPGAGLHRDHGHRDLCGRHYEADVPPIDGALLCGGCHIAEYQARQGDQ